MSDNEFDSKKAMEMLLSGLNLDTVGDGINDKGLKSLLDTIVHVYEEKFGDTNTSDNGLNLEEIVHGYEVVRGKLDSRGMDYQSYGPLNKLTSDDLQIDEIEEDDEKDDEGKDKEASDSEDTMDRMVLERKDDMELNKEVNIYYAGGGSLWIEGIDGDKSVWLKDDADKSVAAMPEEPSAVVQGEYEDGGLSITEEGDGYVIDYSGVKLAHDVGSETETEASLGTVVTGSEADVEASAFDFHTLFYLPEEDGEIDPRKLDEGKEAAAPSEWVCSLGVVDV